MMVTQDITIVHAIFAHLARNENCVQSKCGTFNNKCYLCYYKLCVYFAIYAHYNLKF